MFLSSLKVIMNIYQLCSVWEMININRLMVKSTSALLAGGSNELVVSLPVDNELVVGQPVDNELVVSPPVDDNTITPFTLHYTTLYYTILHYTTLHYDTLHYTKSTGSS